MGSNSTMARMLQWLLCLVCIVTIQGFSPQDASKFKLTMTPKHYLHVDPNHTSTLTLKCILRDEAGQPVPLAECEYRSYYDKYTMQFNEGPASRNYTHSDEWTGRYQGKGLEHGECGLTITGFRERVYCLLIGCRVRSLTGVRQIATMLFVVTTNSPMQYHLEPRVTLALAGSDVTLQGKAEHVLDYCGFSLPTVKNTVWLNFRHGPGSANHSLGRYHGSGLDNKECGITLLNVQPERSGFVRGEVDSTSNRRSLDFIELIVTSPPDDVGMTNTTTSEGGILSATCWSKKSRPVANITWLLDDRVIRQDSTNEGEETEWLWDHDPQSITQHLLHNVTQEDNGKQLVCRVEHMALALGVVNISKAVNVEFPPDYVNMKQVTSELKLGDEVTFTYAPVFESPPEEQIIAVGQPFTLVVKATGNPLDINYTWTKGVDNVTVVEGRVLDFTSLGVDNSGWYTCTAVNSVGSAAWTFKLTVMDQDLTTYYIIAGATCAVLIVALGVLIAFLRSTRRLCWAVEIQPFKQEMASSTHYENTYCRR